MVTIILIIIIAAAAKAVMDKSAINQLSSPWWNKSESWKNKWAIGLPLQEKKLWYYLWVFTPKYKERFVYSSTVFVFLTDGWHLSQFFFLHGVFIPLALHYSLFGLENAFWDFMCTYIVIKGGFNVIFQTVYQFVKF